MLVILFDDDNDDKNLTTGNNNSSQAIDELLEGHNDDKCVSRSVHDSLGNSATTHAKTHTHEKIYRCREKGCGKKFAEEVEYYNHKPVHHSQFKCDKCGDVFGQRQLLAKHSRVHAGEKLFQQYKESEMRKETTALHDSPLSEAVTLSSKDTIVPAKTSYECTVCGKKFTRSSSVTIHMRLHTGEKPYVCQICGEHFAVLRCLKQHSLKVHANEKLYKCTEKGCGKRFNYAVELKNHKLIHQCLRKGRDILIEPNTFYNEDDSLGADSDIDDCPLDEDNSLGTDKDELSLGADSIDNSLKANCKDNSLNADNDCFEIDDGDSRLAADNNYSSPWENEYIA